MFVMLAFRVLALLALSIDTDESRISNGNDCNGGWNLFIKFICLKNKYPLNLQFTYWSSSQFAEVRLTAYPSHINNIQMCDTIWNIRAILNNLLFLAADTILAAGSVHFIFCHFVSCWLCNVICRYYSRLCLRYWLNVTMNELQIREKSWKELNLLSRGIRDIFLKTAIFQHVWFLLH